MEDPTRKDVAADAPEGAAAEPMPLGATKAPPINAAPIIAAPANAIPAGAASAGAASPGALARPAPADAGGAQPKRGLDPDDVLIQDLKHPESQQILLPAGTVLTDSYIRKIINLDLVEAALACLQKSQDLRLEALQLARGLPFEYALYLEGKRVVEDLLDVVHPNTLPEQRDHIWNKAMTYVGRMVDTLLARDLNIFVDYRIYDAYRHAHPLNTATISILIAQAARVSRPRLVEIGLSALLADLGKTRVPFQILNKPGRLEPEELVQARGHVLHSKAIAESFRWAAGDIIHVALHHHERYDGSGYPKQLSGRSIGEFARIVGMADAYDAMISDVPYRPRMEPAVAYRLVTTTGAFDPQVIAAFKKRITPYPLGLQVRLNNGKEGIVFRNYADNPFRPSLIVGDDEVDLAKEPGVRITGQLVPRRYHRTSVMLPVRIRPSVAPECAGVAVNISLAGLCIESEQIPPGSEALAVTLPVLGRDATVNLEGHLTWVRHASDTERTTYGLSIVPLTPEDRTLLVDLILGLP